MPLESGTRLGPYEVAASLGEGGMGEVYRARDTRLGRDVAIKILPAQYAADPEWRRRLDREARAISSLSHPNICPLFDVGHQDGVDFLVMELLEGETLAARMTRGPLPIDQVLRYGAEIASALAVAHRQGVVHRDLKPGNVMLTRSGARLLDFGLAKPAAPGAGGPIDVTASAPITAQGTLVGTYPYMSPEQLEGREIDARSDIFALGAVLYEMATGKRAFDGKTTASLIAAILERDPAPIASLQPLAPAALDDIVRGCLAKDPDERWQTAHDVKLQLDGLRRRLSGGGTDSVVLPAGASTEPPTPRHALGAYAIAAVALAALAAVVWWPRADGVPEPAVRTVHASLLPPKGHWFTQNDFQISPDGSRVAFVAAGGDGVSSLFYRAMGSPVPVEILGTDGATAPFWSPDNRWIAYFAGGRLMKVEPGGGSPQQICLTTVNASGGSWGVRDVIVFQPNVSGPLLSVPASGGSPRAVTTVPPESPGEAHRFPSFLPDGHRFIYSTIWANQQRAGLYLADLEGGPSRLLADDIRDRVTLAGAQLLYVDKGVLYARGFDTASAQLTGSARSVLRGEVVASWSFGNVPLSASQNGILLYQSRLTYNTELVLYDRSGTELEVVGQPGFGSPLLSPGDERWLAVTHDRDGTGEYATTLLDRVRNIPLMLPSVGTHTAHAWSPDRRWIYYSALRGRNGIYRRLADGSGSEETVLESDAPLLVNDHSPTGSRLLFMDFSGGPLPELRQRDLESGTSVRVGEGAEGAYSPDGRWIAFIAIPSGIVITSADGAGGRIQLTSGLSSQARWATDMTEIFYIDGDKRMMRVPITVRNGTIEPGKPSPLFQTRIIQPRLVLFQYDVNRAGDRFLINSLPRADAAAPLTMIVNWDR
jgi:Tol biopolymer transport system component